MGLICKLLHVSHAAYNACAAGKRSRRTAENEHLAEKIEKIHMMYPDKGYRRINDDLRHDERIYVNDKRILRICRVKGIKSTVKYNNHSCARKAKNPQFLAENLLNWQYYADKPNQKWLTAVAANPDSHPLFHSDRGFQYTNRTFHSKQFGYPDAYGKAPAGFGCIKSSQRQLTATG